MARIAVLLDETLVQDMGDGQEVPVDGAVEAMLQLQNEGHELVVLTNRFRPMPASEKQRLKEQIEQDLGGHGFPPMEVWTGTTLPDVDLTIGRDCITFDNDWSLALAQTSVMLDERGLTPGPVPDDGSMEGMEDTSGGGGEEPQE